MEVEGEGDEEESCGGDGCGGRIPGGRRAMIFIGGEEGVGVRRWIT